MGEVISFDRNMFKRITAFRGLCIYYQTHSHLHSHLLHDLISLDPCTGKFEYKLYIDR